MIKFPTSLRKMWSGSEVQKWIDENVNCLPDYAKLYEELRKKTDGGSESMTHEDALKQIDYWVEETSKKNWPFDKPKEEEMPWQ